jgi:hypothetical protein
MMSSNKYDPEMVKAIIEKIASMSPEQMDSMRKLLGLNDEGLSIKDEAGVDLVNTADTPSFRNTASF